MDELLEALLDVASAAARTGGRMAEALRGKGEGYFSWKGSRDPFVSQSLEVQNAIVSVIRERYPDAAILAEEGPEDEPLPVDANPLWVVDPICGSLNYMHGDPQLRRSVVAVRVDETWEVGVVYEPARDLLYTGVGGRGARCNGATINVDQFGDGTEAINRAVVGIDFPGEVGPRAEMLNIAGTLLPTVLTLRVIGLAGAGAVQGCQRPAAWLRGLESAAVGRGGRHGDLAGSRRGDDQLQRGVVAAHQ